MRWNQWHASDEDLLLWEEDELRPRRRSRVDRHLRECRRCAQRSRALQEALAALTGACRDARPAERDAHASRASLLARLAQESDSAAGAAGPTAWPRLLWRGGALAAAGLAAAAIVAVLSDGPHEGGGARSSVALRGGGPETALPRRDLTPGVVRTVSVDEICRRERDAASPLVAASVARQVFENYGADYRRAEEYELDFLITPELGGTADARNLWPQPYGSTRWNAYVKDELEQLFRRLVCDGTIDISTAQREMATDWIAAYRRYFDTDHPRTGAARRDG